MSDRVAVIFFSSTGNTEAMAEAAAVGAKRAGCEVLLASVADVTARDIGTQYDRILLGCSAWGVETIEDSQMLPFSKALEPFLKGKVMGVFGSCGWSRGAWLNSWKADLHFAGAVFPASPVLAYGYPGEEDMKNCEALGEAVAKAGRLPE